MSLLSKKNQKKVQTVENQSSQEKSDKKDTSVSYAWRAGKIATYAMVICICTTLGICAGAIVTASYIATHIRSAQRQVDDAVAPDRDNIEKWIDDHGIILDDTAKQILTYVIDLGLEDPDEPITDDYIKECIYAGITGALHDTYTVYVPPEDYEETVDEQDGEIVGIGVRIERRAYDGVFTITSVVEGGPADQAGIKPGDLINKINGEFVTRRAVSEITDSVRGESGSSVSIEVVRGEEKLTFNVIRSEVAVQKVASCVLSDGTGYLRLYDFEGTAEEEFNSALDELLADGIENLILDLRGNAGGNQSIVEKIAGRFVGNQTLATIRGRKDISDGKIVSRGNKVDVNLIVLVDDSTASASEVLCGALADLNDTILIGRRTFGKGIVQMIIPLDNGGCLRITTGRYYLPNGEYIHKVGIEPVIEVKDRAVKLLSEIESDKAVQKAQEVFSLGYKTASEIPPDMRNDKYDSQQKEFEEQVNEDAHLESSILNEIEETKNK